MDENNQNNQNEEIKEVEIIEVAPTQEDVFGINDDMPIYRTVETEEVLPFGFVKRLISIFVAPTLLAKNIRERPIIGMPYLLAVLLAFPTIFLGKMLTEVTTLAMSDYVLTQYGIDMMAIQQASGQSLSFAITPLSIITTIMSAFATVILSSLVMGLFLWIVSKIAGGKSTFKQNWAVSIHQFALTSVIAIIPTALMVALGTVSDFTSLAPIVAPGAGFGDTSFYVFSAISVSSIWGAVFTCIGLKEINGFTMNKAITVAVIMFILSIIATAVIGYASIAVVDFSMSQFAAMQ